MGEKIIDLKRINQNAQQQEKRDQQVDQFKHSTRLNQSQINPQKANKWEIKGGLSNS